jgi:hypothetical protein
LNETVNTNQHNVKNMSKEKNEQEPQDHQLGVSDTQIVTPWTGTSFSQNVILFCSTIRF